MVIALAPNPLPRLRNRLIDWLVCDHSQTAAAPARIIESPRVMKNHPDVPIYCDKKVVTEPKPNPKIIWNDNKKRQRMPTLLIRLIKILVTPFKFRQSNTAVAIAVPIPADRTTINDPTPRIGCQSIRGDNVEWHSTQELPNEVITTKARSNANKRFAEYAWL